MKMQNLKATANWIPFALSLFGALLLLLSLFLPYATAIGEYAERLEENPDEIVDTQFVMKAHEFMNISVVEFASIYSRIDDSFNCMIRGYLIVAFSVLTLLFAANKKPVVTIVFSLLAVIGFLVQKWDFFDRGIVPSSRYALTTGYYLFYFAAVVVIVGALWILLNVLIEEERKKMLQEEHNPT